MTSRFAARGNFWVRISRVICKLSAFPLHGNARRANDGYSEGRTPDFDQTESAHAEVDLKILLIPNDYLNDVPLRLQLYKRISSATSDELLSEIEMK